MYLAPSLTSRPAVYTAPRLERRPRREVEVAITDPIFFTVVVGLALFLALGAWAICRLHGGSVVRVAIDWRHLLVSITCVR